MKRRKKVKLNYSKERVLFSDVLPYECPIIFSNKYLYRFLAKYLWVGKVGKKETQLKQTKRTDEEDSSAFAALLRIRPERCQLYIRITSGRLWSFMISISILYSIFAIRVNTLFANRTR